MNFEFLDALLLGLNAAWQAPQLGLLLAGCLIGLMVGALPGLGPASAMALLLPFTVHVSTLGALMLMAAIYYGAQYSGAATAIWTNVPGESSAAMTCNDGHPMALAGRGQQAQWLALAASFVAGSLGVTLLALASPLLVVWSYHFGPVEYVALLAVGLLGAAVLASGGMVRALAMVLLGMLLGLSGTDTHTGGTRFVGDWPQWREGFGFGSLALGLLAVAPLITHLHQPVADPVAAPATEGTAWPSRADWRAVLPALWRGSALGLMLGVFPGGGALLSSWVAYALERTVSSGAQPPMGQGQPRGVVAPEAASSAGAQTAFLPTLALGLPANAVMAVVLGVLVQHHIEPGPQLMGVHPELFWGLVVSMVLGNLLLLGLSVPLLRAWRPLLQLPYKHGLPAVLLLVGMVLYAREQGAWAVWTVAGFGLLGHLLHRLRCEPSLLVLGFVLGPWIESHLRRALLLSRGDWSVFVTRPVSALLLGVAVLLLLVVLLPRRR